jgi:hypothetical protein
MQRPMMGAAEDGQRVRIVTAAFRAKHDVVNIHEYALRTPRNDAPSSVASQDETAHGRRHALRCSRRSRAHVGGGRWLTDVDPRPRRAIGARLLGAHRFVVALSRIRHGPWFVASAQRVHPHATAVDSTDVLRIAARHLDHLWPYFHQLASPLLPTATARLADRQRYLVRASSWFGRTAQRLTRQEQQRRIVVKPAARLATKLRQRFSHRRVRLSRDFESKHAPLERAIIRVFGSITRPVSCHELFDLADRTASGDFEPCLLILGCRHPRDLADDRPAHDAVLKRVLELRQTLECLGNP